MNSTQRQGRVAGLLYLVAVLIGPIGLLYVPDRLIVSGNSAATADNLRSSEWLLRLGIASELVSHVVFIFAVLALFRLFKPVSPPHALSMLLLGAVISVPIAFVSVIHELATLILVSGADFLSVFPRAQLDALAYFFLRLHGQGLMVASIFWGLWLFPFGALVIRSKFIPRLFGFLLMLAGVAYLAHAAAALLLPGYEPLVWKVASKLQIAELPIVFWLAIRGARAPADLYPPAPAA